MFTFNKQRAFALVPKAIGLSLITALAMTFTACSNDNPTTEPGGKKTEQTVEIPFLQTKEIATGDYKGMYMLNEGQWMKNNATLDYLDFTTGKFYDNVYFNGYFSKDIQHIGDTGNDIIYKNGKVWITLNQSGVVMVIDTNTGKVIKKDIQVPNCRCLAYDNGFIYVTSFAGITGKTTEPGLVYKINETTFEITAKVAVGYQPEGLAVLNGKLYVANSGGYANSPEGKYGKTLSIIDLKTFTKEAEDIKLPLENPSHVAVDKTGKIWVNCLGDYNKPNDEGIVIIKNDAPIHTHKIGVTYFDFAGDKVYYCATPWNGQPLYGAFDINTMEEVKDEPIKNIETSHSIATPHGLYINPMNQHIYIMDARNFTAGGAILVYNMQGRYLYSIETSGVCPGHICFLPK